MPVVHRVDNPARRKSDGDPAAYPERLDAALLKTTSVCVLAAIMTILDTTVVNVAQRTFIDQFGSTQAVVAWTATGYTLALAAVIPLTGLAPSGSSSPPSYCSQPARCCARWPTTSRN
jgi:hypothetical protein